MQSQQQQKRHIGQAHGPISRQQQLQAKHQQKQQLNQSQMVGGHQEQTPHWMSMQAKGGQQQQLRDREQMQQLSVPRKRETQFKQINKNSVNSSINSMHPAGNTFSNSGSCSNLQLLGHSPQTQHKGQQNPFIHAKTSKNMRQVSVSTGSTLQQQLQAQALHAAKFGGPQINLTLQSSDNNHPVARVGGPPLTQKKLVQVQGQTSSSGSGRGQQTKNTSLNKQMMQQRQNIVEFSGNQFSVQHGGAEPMGQVNNFGARIISNGKVLSRDQGGNFRNAGGSGTGMAQYSKRNGPPAMQSQNTQQMQPQWQGQPKRANQFGQQVPYNYQQNQKVSIIPNIYNTQAGHKNTKQQEVQKQASAPMSHQNSIGGQSGHYAATNNSAHRGHHQVAPSNHPSIFQKQTGKAEAAFRGKDTIQPTDNEELYAGTTVKTSILSPVPTGPTQVVPHQFKQNNTVTLSTVEQVNNQLRDSQDNEITMLHAAMGQREQYAKTGNQNPYNMPQKQVSVITMGSALAPNGGTVSGQQQNPSRLSFKNSQQHHPQSFLSSGKHNLRHLQEHISDKNAQAIEKKQNSKAINLNQHSALQNHAQSFSFQHQQLGQQINLLNAQQKPGTYAFYYDENFQSTAGSTQSQGSQAGALRQNTLHIQQIPSASLQMVQGQPAHHQKPSPHLGHHFMTPPPFYSTASSHHAKLKHNSDFDITEPGQQMYHASTAGIPQGIPMATHILPNGQPAMVKMPVGNSEYGATTHLVKMVGGPNVRVSGRGQQQQVNATAVSQQWPPSGGKQAEGKNGQQQVIKFASNYPPGSSQGTYVAPAYPTNNLGNTILINNKGEQIMSYERLPQRVQGGSISQNQQSRTPQKVIDMSKHSAQNTHAAHLDQQMVQYQNQVNSEPTNQSHTQQNVKVGQFCLSPQEAQYVAGNIDFIERAKETKANDAIMIASSSMSSNRRSIVEDATNPSPSKTQGSFSHKNEEAIDRMSKNGLKNQLDQLNGDHSIGQNERFPYREKDEDSKSMQGDQDTHEDDHLINIQDDEAEIGPVDDEIEEMEQSPTFQVDKDDKPEHQEIHDQKRGDLNADMKYDQIVMTDGGYYDGDEPEEDDSQAGIDENEEFDCPEEDGEEEQLDAEEGEEEMAEVKKIVSKSENKPQESNAKPIESEVDTHSKVSTACTNGDQQLIKIKTQDAKTKRRSTKTKKNKARQKAYGEGLDGDIEGLDEEQKQRRLDMNVLDQQLDQLVIQKPAGIVNQPGKDRSLKEAFLRRPPNNIITLTYGPIPGRPPTIFFNYPPFLQKQRPYVPNRIVKMTQDDMKPHSTLTFKINNSTHTYNCVVNAFKTAGFRISEGGAWNCLWTGLIRPSKLKYMNQFQKINHFAGAWNIGHKGNLWRNVVRQRRRHGRDFEICPATYLFPEDYKRWCNDREVTGFREMYIMKPTASSCGKGIRVIGRKQTVCKRSGYLVQKYVSRPHLLRGYKYDMRIYVVVTSFEPLRAYQCQEGLVRLATQPYSTAKGSLKKRFIHLTNFSVNKKADNYKKNALGLEAQGSSDPQPNDQENEEAEEMESKWSLEQLRQEYEKMGISYDDVFKQVKLCCVKALMAVEPNITTAMRQARHRNQSFEIYGFDIMIDAKLRPWLLEVNVAPSLSSSSPYDKKVKTLLLCDTLHLVGFQPFDRKKIEDDKRKETRHRLLGFEPTKHGSRQATVKQAEDSEGNPSSLQPQKAMSLQTPVKQKSLQQQDAVTPDKFDRSAGSKFVGQKEKTTIPSFLDGFQQLTEDDMEILADYEEEQSRKGHLETIFPTKETIETLGPFFDSQRHANNVLWQYIRQKCPIQHVKAYFKAHPTQKGNDDRH